MNNLEPFQLFLERAEELGHTRLVKSGGLQTNLTVSWNAADQQLKTTMNKPDEDDLKAFLLTFRHFISQDEPIFAGRIFNLLHRQLADNQIREWVAKARKYWNSQMKGMDFQFRLNEVEMTPEHVKNVLINGYYFHNDPAHRQELANLPPFERIFVDTLFIHFLVGTTNVINYLARVISHCLREGLFKDAATAPS